LEVVDLNLGATGYVGFRDLFDSVYRNTGRGIGEPVLAETPVWPGHSRASSCRSQSHFVAIPDVVQPFCSKGTGAVFMNSRWARSRLRESFRPDRIRNVHAISGSTFIKTVKLNRNRLLAALVILMVLAALPGAVRDTLETGRVYLFSRQFFEELPQRFSGPGRLRFIFQPLLALFFGVRSGLHDARIGNPPYISALLFHGHRRKELLHSGLGAIGHLLAAGILLDAVAQLLIYKQLHPGAAIVIGPLLVCLPYAVTRGLTARLARWLKREHSMSS
jgi:hypothetical protein